MKKYRELFHYIIHQKTSHVKIVNHHIQKDPAGYLDIVDRRRSRITTGYPQQMGFGRLR
jgi:hypothetical protein